MQLLDKGRQVPNGWLPAARFATWHLEPTSQRRVYTLIINDKPVGTATRTSGKHRCWQIRLDNGEHLGRTRLRRAVRIVIGRSLHEFR